MDVKDRHMQDSGFWIAQDRLLAMRTQWQLQDRTDTLPTFCVGGGNQRQNSSMLRCLRVLQNVREATMKAGCD